MILALAITMSPPALSAEWTLVGEENDCRIYVDTTSETYNGRAVCSWTDVTAQQVASVLHDPARAPEIFSNVLSSKVVQKVGNRPRVFQVHAFPVGSDRESHKNVVEHPLPDGVRIEWSLVDDPPAPQDGRVTLETDDGYWQVRQGAGATEVELFMAYDPGGFLGLLPASKAMANGMVTTLEELRAGASR